MTRYSGDHDEIGLYDILLAEWDWLEEVVVKL